MHRVLVAGVVSAGLFSGVVSVAALAESTAEVTQGSFKVEVERDGTLQAKTHAPIRYAPEAYGGGLVVKEVLVRSGRVNAGQPIVRLEAKSISDDLRNATESLEDARKRLEWTRQEQEMARESAAISMEQAEKNYAAAQRALKVFMEFDGPKQLKQSELGLQNSQNNVDDQKEELEQLEAMYKGTTLATGTKDIVLERARRGLKMAIEYLELTQADRKLLMETHYPVRQKDVEDGARWAKVELEHAKRVGAIAEARRVQDMVNAERAVRDAEARLAKLRADEAGLTLNAPMAGVMSPLGVAVGDSVSGRQDLAEVYSGDDFEVKLSVAPADLRILAAGMDGRVEIKGLPEADVPGSVGEISPVAGGDGMLATTVTLRGRHELHRQGMPCRVEFTRVLEKVLSVPSRAVATKDGVSSCQVKTASGVETREVAVGQTSGDRVQILRGLEAGDVVVVPDEKP